MDEYEEKVIRHEEMLKSLEDKISMKIETIMQSINKNNEELTKRIDKLDKKVDSLSNSIGEIKEDIPNIVDKRIKENTGAKAYNILRWIVTSVVGATAVSVLVKLLSNHLGV